MNINTQSDFLTNCRKGISRYESEYMDLLWDKISYFLKKGADSVPTYNVSLTYENGKVN